MALTDNLVAYYKFEEGSGGNRAATVGGVTLTDNNTCPTVAGKSGNGVGFTTANSEYLSATDNDIFSIDIGEDGFTVAFWAYPTVSGGSGGMVAKGYLNGGNHLEWQILQRTADDAAVFHISYDGEHVAAAVSAPMTINAWNFIACRYRSSDGQMTCRTACGSDGTATLSPNTPHNDTGAFNVGRLFNNVADYWQGRIDELGIWHRRLTDEELGILCTGTSFYPFAPVYTNVWSWVG